jgi:hypothetical protein
MIVGGLIALGSWGGYAITLPPNQTDPHSELNIIFRWVAVVTTILLFIFATVITRGKFILLPILP